MEQKLKFRDRIRQMQYNNYNNYKTACSNPLPYLGLNLISLKLLVSRANMSHLLTQILMTKLSLVSPFVKKFKVKWFGSGNRKWVWVTVSCSTLGYVSLLTHQETPSNLKQIPLYVHLLSDPITILQLFWAALRVCGQRPFFWWHHRQKWQSRIHVN